MRSATITLALSRDLEFVAQGELHDTRIGQQAGIVPERGRQLLQRCNACTSLSSQTRERVEAVKVRHVEYFPSELQAVALDGHLPALVQCHVEGGESVSPDYVSRSSLPRKGMYEVVECGSGIGKSAHSASSEIAMMS